MDTSIYNFVIADDVPREREVTLKLIDEIKHGKYEVFISDVVVREINDAPDNIALKLRDVINEVSPTDIPIDEEVETLADKYVAEKIIPEKYRDDALHIAAASIHNMDVIVSWNFKHIVKLKTKKEVVGINSLMGYKEIEIYSPMEVIEND